MKNEVRKWFDKEVFGERSRICCFEGHSFVWGVLEESGGLDLADAERMERTKAYWEDQKRRIEAIRKAGKAVLKKGLFEEDF